MKTGWMTRRIMRWYDQATPEEIEEGISWYAMARREAIVIAARYGITYEQAAAVIAVLSPNVKWENNVQSAHRACEWYARFGALARIPGYCGYGANVVKADRVLSGDIDAVSGPKVVAFFNAIMGDMSTVVVDIWAARAARSKDRLKATMYTGSGEMPGAIERRAMQKAYKNAAAKINVEPAHMQAIVWVVIRNRTPHHASRRAS